MLWSLESRNMKYYRFIVNGVGIYEAVDRDCPKDNPCRLDKPDGSLLPKKGPEYPGAMSFWTDYGLKKYFDSGLLHWHASVVGGNIEVIVVEKPDEVLYEDEYQIIFKPEFLNRVDDVIVFRALNRDDLEKIVEIEVQKVLRRLKDKIVEIHLSPEVKNFLIEKGYDPGYGARPLRRAVERYLEDPLAEEILKGNIKPDGNVDVVLVDGKLTFNQLTAHAS